MTAEEREQQLKQLKVAHYDTLIQVEHWSNRLKQINAKIAEVTSTPVALPPDSPLIPKKSPAKKGNV